MDEDRNEEEEEENKEKENEEEGKEEETPAKLSFTSLEDVMENPIFDAPIKTCVNKSIGEVIIMIIKYSLIYSLSLSGMTDLFKLVNCIFAESIIPNSKYFIDKLFYPKNCVILHATCTQCGSYIGKFKREDRWVKCKVCKLKIETKSYVYKDFFVTMDVSKPIRKLIETNSEYYNYVMNDRLC